MSTPVRFKYTGNETIDRILKTVEAAGSCYHDVNKWCEEDDWRDGKSLEDVISSVAKDAADEFQQLREALEKIASCTPVVSGDTVSIARAVLSVSNTDTDTKQA